MNGLLTPENLPVIIGLVLSANGVFFVKELINTVRAWRAGASERARDLLMETLMQLERCNHERDRASKERDTYLRQVGKRDYLLLVNGLAIPEDGHDPHD